MFGDGSAFGIRIRYVVEPEPLGTAGGIKFASRGIDGPIVVFNGDVLTRDRSRRPSSRCTASGSATRHDRADAGGESRARSAWSRPTAGRTSGASSRSRNPAQITTNRINAGIYVLEPSTFDRIPDGVPWSIERKYFPSLIERGETFVAYRLPGLLDRHRDAARSTSQVHHDILDGPLPRRALPRRSRRPGRACRRGRAIGAGATIESPCFIDDGVDGRGRRAHRPLSVVGRGAPHRGRRRGGRRHRVAGLRRRPRRHASAARSSAATATSAPVSVVGGAGAVLGDGTQSHRLHPRLTFRRHASGHQHLQGLRRARPVPAGD